GLISGQSDVGKIPEDKVAEKKGIKDGITTSEVISPPSNERQEAKEETKNESQLGKDWATMDWKESTQRLYDELRKRGQMNSGSETSDNEMNFEKLTDNYRDWSAQYQAQQRREANRVKKLQELKEKKQTITKTLKELKTNISEKHGEKCVEKLENKEIDLLADKYKAWKEKRNQRGVIFISGLPFGATAFQLRKIFTDFGKVTNIHLEAASF
ncbi:hypothetical protein RFI_36019, partial [Reticulomyxa filosa]